MKLSEIETTARAAFEPLQPSDWYKQDGVLADGVTSVRDRAFIEIASPATVLKLIEIIMAQRETLEWASTLIKNHCDPGACVTRDEEQKTSLDVYADIALLRKLLSDFEEA